MKLRPTIKSSAILLLSAGLLWGNVFADTTTTTTTSTAASSSNSFLDKNKTRPGVITTADGLQYKVIKPGTGNSPTDADTVTVNYEGRLVNGTVFDSSYKRGQPASFPVNGVIAGWTEALKLMKVGSTYELFIPAELAYGSEGAPPAIGPNETLIFKVELLGIQK